MYKIDARDRIVELTDVPEPSMGAPCPMLIADEHQLWLAFYLEAPEPGWDGTTIRMVNKQCEEPCAVVRFKGVYVHLFGPPDEMRTHLHPLGERGLGKYTTVEVLDSSWIRELRAFHVQVPHHYENAYNDARHFIIAFHDSCFECVANSFEVTVLNSSIMDALADVIAEN